jgi:hypothetical protein
MPSSKASLQRWLNGQRRASRRIAREASQVTPNLAALLARVEELRRFADGLGAEVDTTRSERENLAFHLTWKRVRRAFGVG